MIRRKNTIFVLMLLAFNVYLTYGQSIKGKVLDQITGQEAIALELFLMDSDHLTFTNAQGNFTFYEIGKGDYTLMANIQQNKVEVSKFSYNGGDLDLGTLSVKIPASANTGYEISTIDISDLAGIENENDNVSSALGASRDPFLTAAAFNLSNGRFRPRGYFNENSEMLMNGMLMNDQDDGRVLWTAWSGLNDVLRNQTQILNLAANDYTFGGIGGGTFVDLRASHQREGTKAVYSLSNRSYQHRWMLTHSSGLMKNGWAYSLSASHRYGNQGYVEGTYFQGTSYFASVDRKINDKHSLNAVIFGTPQRRGRSTGSVQEMYDLAGSNYYNGNWGYQNGEVRNSREYRVNQPVAMLRHDWKIGKKSSLMTNLGYQWGTYGSTRLDWYDAPDPRPDYYRRLPSYVQDPELKQTLTNYLSGDINNRQLNWASLYSANESRNYTINDVNGIAGNNVTGKLAAYIVEEEHFDNEKFNFNTILNSNISDKFNMTSGFQYQLEKVHYYRQVDDLLGADFYVDYNRFALRSFPDNISVIQNDLNNPNRLLKEGDIFGYNYKINTSRAFAWTQATYKTTKFDYFAAASLTRQSFFREGFNKNGLFPDNSFGKSETQDFTNYGLKAGVTYKLDGRNYFVANGSYRTRAPFANESFVSPRTRDQVVNNLTSEKITSGEVSYLARYPKFKGRLTAFYTEFKDKITNDVFYHEEFQSFVNYILTGISTRHQGLEMGLEYNVTSKISVTAAGSLGDYIYKSRPYATISTDNGAVDVVQDRLVYIKNYYVAGMPQNAGTVGLNYRGVKYWFFNVNVNFFGKNYLQFNPDRRTIKAVELVDPIEQSELFGSIIDEEKLPNAMTVDIFCGKSYRFKNGGILAANLNVGNILNNKTFITGGFEQLRFDFEEKNVNKFPPRYFYAYGTNFSLNLSYVF